MKRWLCVWFVLPMLLVAGETDVVTTKYGGWEECYEFSAPQKKIKALMVLDVGARLIQYSLDGENILFDPVDSRGKTLAKNKEGFWTGGYQIDVGPEMRGIPAHKDLWMGPWNAAQRGGVGPVVARSVDSAVLGVRLTKRVSIDGNGVLSVAQAIENVTDKDLNYCLWDRTLCEGGGYSLIPLNPKSRFKAGWCWGTYDAKLPGGWAYNGDNPESPNVKVLDGVLVAHCLGKHSKLGTDSHAGWIAYARGKLLFIKQYPVDLKGNYTDGGMTVANYWSERVAELEPISSEVVLKPGGNYAFDEKWYLVALEEAVDSHEKARGVVGVIEKVVGK